MTHMARACSLGSRVASCHIPSIIVSSMYCILSQVIFASCSAIMVDSIATVYGFLPAARWPSTRSLQPIRLYTESYFHEAFQWLPQSPARSAQTLRSMASHLEPRRTRASRHVWHAMQPSLSGHCNRQRRAGTRFDIVSEKRIERAELRLTGDSTRHLEYEERPEG